MTALLLGVGALLLAVVAGALLDPQPSNTDRADDQVPSMDAIALITWAALATDLSTGSQ
jgi:hypothetical protein